LKLSPTIAVITNIDREHLDYYPGIEEIKAAFLKFANIVPFYGCTVMCNDNEHVRAIAGSIKRRVITYGIDQPADYSASDIRYLESKTLYHLSYRGENLGDTELIVPGLFNVYNSMAATAVGRELGLDMVTIRRGLLAFSGVQRRLEIKGQADGITVVDDYGHHPTEIMATLAAARQMWKGRLIVVFQPHRFTRTKALFDEFTRSFGNADILVLNDIYPASEAPIPGVHSAALWVAIKEGGHPCVEYIAQPQSTIEFLMANAKPGDTILTLGAGSVYKIGEAFLLQRKQGMKKP